MNVFSFNNSIENHIEIFSSLSDIEADFQLAVNSIKKSLINGGRIFICGNGGSAADSQHFAAEFIVRYRGERNSIPAVALTTDTSVLTAIGNDYSFESLFSRQLKGLGRAGDVLIALSTSGRSSNILAALSVAHELGMESIGLCGERGFSHEAPCTHEIKVPSNITARIQECHIFILHSICEMFEDWQK